MTISATHNELVPLGPTALAPFSESAEEALGEIFGHSDFRAGQKEAVDRVVGGGDAVVVIPTGAGKSLCYQLAAAVCQGVGLVVSPLIALMDDQVTAVEATGLPATTIHSSMSWKEQRRRIDGMYMGDYKLVYVAPERFRSRRFCTALEDVEIAVFAVDEAHCISQWGHDFRPDYRNLARVRKRFGSPPAMALTATATRRVQRDIVDQLALDDPAMICTGFERPNLYFEVEHTSDHREKNDRLAAIVDHWEGESIIVYGATRKQVRSVTATLCDAGVDAASYHAGMSAGDRRDVQQRWMADQVDVLVATNAFGMGVDKPDVRAVVHFNMPGSVEAYYQQAGRAGRDGEPADCVLLFNRADRGIHEWFADNTHPLRMELIRVWMYLCEQGEGEHELTADKIAAANPPPGSKIHPMAVDTCLTLLARAGHIRRSSGTIEVVEKVKPLELDVELSQLGERRRIAKDQVAKLVDYAETSECLQAALLDHFGDSPDFGQRCENCGRCDPPAGYRRKTRVDVSPVVVGMEPESLLREVLTGVARCEGRRGVKTVAAMLVGSTARAVRDAGFTELDSWGSLESLRRKDAAALIEMAARHGLVRRNEHGCPLLTSIGAEVMRGESPPEALRGELARNFGRSD